LVITAKGSKIKTAVATITGNQRIVATGNLLVIRVDQKKINPFYLKVFLDSMTGQKLLRSVQTGSVIPTINPSQLNDIEISKPAKALQDKIAARFLAQRDMLQMTKERLEELKTEIASLYDQMIEDDKK
jgi:type I restriction enzyme M protein